jgi:hypothetical protein
LHLEVPLNLIEAPEVENSQRTRGLVYTGIGTAIAACADVRSLLIFENGYGAINPRLFGYQEGAQATKSAHPFVVGSLEDLYSDLGFLIRLEQPHCLQTKAELLLDIPAILRDGIRVTASCDSFPLRLRENKQCGFCGSCILRQQSLRQSGLEAFDRSDYANSPFKGGNRVEHLSQMAYQAKQFLHWATPERWDDATRLWPEIALGGEGQVSFSQIELLDMLRRYGAEWENLAANDPVIAQRIGWRVKS